MAIRLRNIDGMCIALCAAECDAKPNDIYLDDSMHHALSTKFGLDFYSEGFLSDPMADERLVVLMEKEKAHGEIQKTSSNHRCSSTSPR